MQIIENVLPQASFLRLRSYIMGPAFQWYYIPNIAHQDGKDVYSPGFSFKFFDNESMITDPVGYELAFGMLANACDKINHDLATVLQARAFMTIPHKEGGVRQIHNDMLHNHNVCLYFLSDHDEDDEEAKTYFYDSNLNVTHSITPKANSAVMFDGCIPHAGGYSDRKRRVVININYMTKTPMAPHPNAVSE